MYCHICNSPATFTCRVCQIAGCNQHYTEGAICLGCVQKTQRQAIEAQEYERQRKANPPKCAFCNKPSTFVLVDPTWSKSYAQCQKCSKYFCSEHGKTRD